jgi:hypothetical protein
MLTLFRLLLAASLLFLSGCDQPTTPSPRKQTQSQLPTQAKTPRSPRQFVSSIPASPDSVTIGTWVDSTPISGSRITIITQEDAIYADQVFTYDGSGRTLRLRESESPLGRRFDEIEKDLGDSEQSDRGMSATNTGREYARTKLAELDKFKSSAAFREYGFAIGGPFNAWLKDVDAKSHDPQSTFYDKLAAGNLSALGSEYLRSKGKETDFSQITRREILEIIESGTIDTDFHDYWILDANGDLQLRDKDGLIATASKAR